MCLHVTSGKLIAEEDIYCYKVLSLIVNSNKRLELESTHFFKKWSPNKLYTLSKKIIVQKEIGVEVINEGFHSYRYSEDAKRKFDNYFNKIVVKCIIPKGAIYYKGTINGREYGYVSNKIKILML